MQSLIDANLATVQRDNYMLQYVLAERGMLSTTAYRVLQSQEKAGLISCCRVTFNGFDKLDYDVEQYNDLKSLLPGMRPEVFLHYVQGVLTIALNLGSIGFLHPANLETSLDKIFIKPEDNSVHMIYLPIADEFLSHMNQRYEQSLKTSLLDAIGENRNLKSEHVSKLYGFLSDEASTLEQVKSALESLGGQNPTPQADDTASISQTGEMRSEELAPPSPLPKRDKGLFKKSIFKKRAADVPQLPTGPEVGGTEVLAPLFVPSIVLLGSQKDEILISKQDFVIGKQPEKVDHAIEYSAAISRVHCKITQSEGRSFVTDIDSSNGTYVNGRRLESQTPVPINDGDKLKLGNVSFIVRNI